MRDLAALDHHMVDRVRGEAGAHGEAGVAGADDDDGGGAGSHAGLVERERAPPVIARKPAGPTKQSRRQRNTMWRLRLDCFVALRAPRNDEQGRSFSATPSSPRP